MATPGIVVPSGNLISPAGVQGPPGSPGGAVGPVGPPSSPKSFLSLSANYSISQADTEKYFICAGGSWTLSLPNPLPTLVYRVRNDNGLVINSAITIQPSGAASIDGLPSIQILAGQECTIYCDGANWRTFGLQREVIIDRMVTGSVANVTILLPNGYRYFEFLVDSIILASEQQNVAAVISYDGGATFPAVNYYGALIYNNAATTTGSGTSINAANWPWLIVGGRSTASQLSCRIQLFAGDAANCCAIISDGGTFLGTSAVPSRWLISAFQSGLARVNAIRFIGGGGNIGRSSWTVKGLV